MPLYLILGVGKTGTTVVSKAIHHSLPGSHYHMEPRSVGVLEQLAEPKDTRVVKILYSQWDTRPHLLDALVLGETEFKADKTVAIVRDPRDSAVSGLMYCIYVLVTQGATREQVERWVDCVRRKEADPISLSLFGMLEEMHGIFGTGFAMMLWIQQQFDYLDWLARHREHLYVLRYEDFVAGDVAGLEDYLGFALSTSRDVGEYDRVRRTQGAGNWKSLMLPDDVTKIREEFGPRFADAGYTDWDLPADARLDPAHGSEYIRRVAEDAFASLASAPEALAKTLSFKPTAWRWGL
jgi:hypothetical protein